MSVNAARARGEVYIHQQDHGCASPTPSPGSSPRAKLFQGPEAAFATGKNVRGEFSSRTVAALRISEYRARYPNEALSLARGGCERIYAERDPAVPLFFLSDSFMHKSPRRKHYSPGTRAQLWTGKAGDLLES